MNKRTSMSVRLVVILGCLARVVVAQPPGELHVVPPPAAASEPFLLGPPRGDGPVVVRAGFQFHDLYEINDEAETFEFTGVLRLRWHDPRQAFDPAAAGVDEKVFQGDYQFDEISPAWFPQVVLVNESGLYEKHGVVLRARADGTTTLVQTVNAVAKAEFGMRRFPFDRQRLEAVFEVLGFDKGEVLLEVDPEAADFTNEPIRIPQWTLTGIDMSTRERPACYAGRRGVASAFVVSVEAQRQSFFIVRLVMIPLAVIVLLSFSVFWMDRSSLGDRINVSFIGILTAVAYQFIVSDIQPHISYFTLMNGFVNLSFLTMCATVVINLVVGALDKRGKTQSGDRLDRCCRWIFPLSYFGLIVVVFGVAFLWF